MLVAEWSYDGAKKIISLQMGEEAAQKNKEGTNKKEEFQWNTTPFPAASS